jgi:SAM-dependent methyltransferase
MLTESLNLVEKYDELYSTWYMADWPKWKKRRIVKIIRSLKLPATGKILDYGCGSGVFTRVLKEALPTWEVYGSDISEEGLKLARKISSDINYVTSQNLKRGYFDLIFSHHVLEHVDDIFSVKEDLNSYAKREAVMVHILPCGNKGSLDHYIASHTKDGINYHKGNTFFYEEELHLNRFTTVQLENLFKESKWNLVDSLYANHHLGCFSEMAGANTQDIKKVTDSKNAVDGKSKLAFKIIRLLAMSFYYLQRPYTYFKLRKLNKAWTGPLLRHPELAPPRFALAELLLFPSYIFVLLRNTMERVDWKFFKCRDNGSEMYLIFKK